jgi:diguanylate cyclase (GGDEF)-like protein/PAS domain S-box-containing protein
MQLGDDFYKRLLDNLYDGVYFTNTDRVITYWNKAAERITGLRADEVVGTSCRDNVLNHVDEDGANLCVGLCPLAVSIREQALHEREIWLHHKEGHRIPVLVRVAPVHDNKGTLIGAVEIFSDRFSSDEMRNRVEELERMAMMDSLTKAANRGYTETVLQQRLEEYRRYGWPFGVLFFDIDNFKKVNDTYGHAAGDKVLAMTARTLMYNVRSFDLCGRWGGEEFLVVVRASDHESLRKLASKLWRLVGSSILHEDDRVVLRATVSVGATLVMSGDTAEAIVARADSLMYESKRAGKNRVTVG